MKNHAIKQDEKRILVIDDEELPRQVLIEFLTIQGYHTADAESGPLALALLPLFHPDLVILDIFMPGMDGVEVLRRMMLWDPDIKIIMLTAAEDLDIARETMRLGAIDYITKPYEFDQLEMILSVHLLLQTEA